MDAVGVSAALEAGVVVMISWMDGSSWMDEIDKINLLLIFFL